MLVGMSYARTWTQLEALLPPGWTAARISFRVEDEAMLPRAGAILGPLNPGRVGDTLIVRLVAGGGSSSTEALRRTFVKLQESKVPFVAHVLDISHAPGAAAVQRPVEPAVPSPIRPGSLALAWDAALATLPADWSDVYGEVEIESSDLLERTALLLGPINPYRNVEKSAFRFRAARLAGYGASVGMVHRCLERVDNDGISGTVTILRALCDTRPVATQGPQWVEGGKNF
jgi:hypothetical protein